MSPLLANVKPLANYKLELFFTNGERKIFDVAPYLSLGVFRELEDEIEFSKVRISFDTVEWENEADIDPETLYEDSIPV
jgi:hypothetical protein